MTARNAATSSTTSAPAIRRWPNSCAATRSAPATCWRTSARPRRVRWQLANCHPFVREWQGRQWSFCHNGDLQGFHPPLTGRFLPVGGTDSERAFCWMLQELERRFGRRRAPGWEQVAPVVAELAERIARHGRFNFLLCNGEALYAHASTNLSWLQRSHPFPTAQLVDDELSLDLSVANGPDDRMVLLATQPLTRNEPWVPFAAGELRVFVAGDSVWCHAPQAATRAARQAGGNWPALAAGAPA